MKIQIATAPCSWGVFYADGGTSGVPYEVFLQQAAEAGYSDLELGPEGYLPEDVGLMREKLDQYGLNVCAGTATIPFGKLTENACRAFVDKLANRLSQLKVNKMVVMDGTLYEPDMQEKDHWDRELWDHIYRSIQSVNDYLARDFDIQMVFHPHAGTAIEYTDEIERMLEGGNVHLCFDTGHHAYSNGSTKRGDQSALAFIRKHRQYVTYLHFKNVDGHVKELVEQNRWPVSKAFENQVMCDLEDGIIDFCALRDLLVEIDYSGIAVIEQDMYNKTAAYAYQTAKKNLQYLREIKMID